MIPRISAAAPQRALQLPLMPREEAKDGRQVIDGEIARLEEVLKEGVKGDVGDRLVLVAEGLRKVRERERFYDGEVSVLRNYGCC